MAKLLLSFTGTLYRIKNGCLTKEDLATAIFYFGASREHALDPRITGEVSELDWISDDPAVQDYVHQMLVSALLKAEQEGRVVWKDIEVGLTFEQLNALLVANNFPALDFAQYNQSHYNYPTVVDAAAVQGLPLEVIWRG